MHEGVACVPLLLSALPGFGWVLRGSEACHPFNPGMNAGAWLAGLHQARLPAGSIRQRLVERRMEPARRGGLERPTALARHSCRGHWGSAPPASPPMWPSAPTRKLEARL